MPVEADQPHVLVAVKALPVGTILDAESFRFQPWPKDLIEQAYYLKGQADPAKLAGSVVRTAISAGQPLTQGGLVMPGDRGFLAAALGAGMRAVTVPVSAQSSVAGFVFPGDRIDLVLTQSVAGGGDGEALKVSETILRNLRVLATDQRMDAMGADGKVLIKETVYFAQLVNSTRGHVVLEWHPPYDRRVPIIRYDLLVRLDAEDGDALPAAPLRCAAN